jgi:hypothetical protein
MCALSLWSYTFSPFAIFSVGFKEGKEIKSIHYLTKSPSRVFISKKEKAAGT